MEIKLDGMSVKVGERETEFGGINGKVGYAPPPHPLQSPCAPVAQTAHNEPPLEKLRFPRSPVPFWHSQFGPLSIPQHVKILSRPRSGLTLRVQGLRCPHVGRPVLGRSRWT